MNNLLSNISPPTIRNIFIVVITAIIGLIVYLIKERLKQPTKVVIDDPIKLDIAGVDELRKRVERLEQEQGKSLPKEKIESCFVPGIKELEAGRKLLQFGQEAQAKSRFEEAIKFFICAADALPCYETFFNLAKVYNDYCDYDNAKENYEKAIQHDPTQPGAYNGLGVVYDKIGNYPKAKDCYHKTLNAAKQLTDKLEKSGWQTNALGNLGSVYFQTGQMEQALEYYQKALKIDREIRNKLGEADDLNNLGLVYRRRGQREQALERHQQALNIFREIGNKPGEADALNNKGIVYLETGQRELALAHHQLALKIYQETGNKLGEAQNLGNLGLVSANTGQIEQARKYYLLARAIFEQIGAPHMVKQADENLAKLPGGS